MQLAAKLPPNPKRSNGTANRLDVRDRAVHDWYRFVLSFPPHLVQEYLHKFKIGVGQRVLDPFCGTGTTLVECRKLGISSVGIEANPMAHFASQVKVDWRPKAEQLLAHAENVARKVSAELRASGLEEESLPLFTRSATQKFNGSLRRLLPEQGKLLLKDSISPLPLHKTLVLLDKLTESPFLRHEKLALAKALVFQISNLHFGPEVGVGQIKQDAPVLSTWLGCLAAMSVDLQALRATPPASVVVHRADARAVGQVVEPESIDAVITSPPYPNEKDYTRTTRLESVLLGFIKCKTDLQALKRSLVRSNTRGVYKGDDDDLWISAHPVIEEIAQAIEARRIELGKTSGFERMYPRVTRLYFGGMAKHLAELRHVLRPGAQLAYVVGDQASYLRIMIRTGHLLAQIAESLGYIVTGIDLFRTRLATATREQLREEVVILRWPGV